MVNHPGANGSIAARAASEAANDGYTLYSPALSTFVALPTVAPNLPVKLPRDFLRIGFIADQPMFISVDPKSGITIAAATDRPRQKSAGHAFDRGVGCRPDDALDRPFAATEGRHQAYSGAVYRRSVRGVGDVAGGRVTMIIEGYPGIIGAANAGQVKLIAVASPQRLPEFPDLPTVAETIPGFAAAGWLIVAAPIGTPAPIIAKVERGHRQGRQRSGREEKARRHRQLYASDDA